MISALTRAHDVTEHVKGISSECTLRPANSRWSSLLFGYENLTPVHVGENGVEDKCRLVLFDPFPQCFFSFSLQGSIDCQAFNSGVLVRRKGPGFFNCFFIVTCLVDGELDIGFREGRCDRRRCKDHALDFGFLGGSLQCVQTALDADRNCRLWIFTMKG